MIHTIDAGRYFHVTGTTPTEVDESLTKAVGLAQRTAQESGWQGILVTRHGHDLYTVRISSEVPYGLTIENEASAK